MRILRAPALYLLVGLVLVFGAYAQEDKGDGGFSFGLSLGIGAETFVEEGDTTPTTYQMLSLSPDIAIGKFGIGLDLTFHYTFTGGADGTSFEVRRADWVPTGDMTILDVYLPKFKYVRWGLKGDPLYVKLGSIDDATLGNGFIMVNYANTLFLPQLRIFGLSFDMDGSLFNFPVVGIETFVANLAQFDVMGFRPFVRPLVYTDIPIIKNLQLGFTLALDRNPGLYVDQPGLQTILLYGGDFRLPILANPLVNLAAFGDVAVLSNRGSLGGAVGLGGRLFGFLNYGAQLRMLGENFIPNYFDASYDLFRYQKYQVAEQAAADIPGYVGWLASLGFAFFDDVLSFNATLDGPFSMPDPGNLANFVNWPHLYAVLELKEGLIPNVSLLASYDKRSLGAYQGFFSDLISPEEAAIQAQLNYSIGAAVLSFVYKLRYDPLGSPNMWEITSGIQSSIKLF